MSTPQTPLGARCSAVMLVCAVDIEVPVPESVLADYDAFRTFYNQKCRIGPPEPEDVVRRAVRSAIVGLNSDAGFNQPRCGVKSRKVRLGILRRQLRKEPVKSLQLMVTSILWEQLKIKAEGDGISVPEFILLAIDYHAGLWRVARDKARPSNPAERFERALSKERRERKPLPENDRSLGRIARLRAVGTAFGLDRETIDRDVVGPVRKRKGGRP